MNLACLRLTAVVVAAAILAQSHVAPAQMVVPNLPAQGHDYVDYAVTRCSS